MVVVVVMVMSPPEKSRSFNAYVRVEVTYSMEDLGWVCVYSRSRQEIRSYGWTPEDTRGEMGFLKLPDLGLYGASGP